MKKNVRGIWFFGLSGSGKSYASNYLKKKIKKSIVIDGDHVRKEVSFDLGYTIGDRKVQIRRVLGIAKIILSSNYFPIISTVYFDKTLYKECSKISILPIKVIRKDIKNIMKNHKTYINNKKNIVGVDILYPNRKVKNLYNNGELNFCKKLNFLTK